MQPRRRRVEISNMGYGIVFPDDPFEDEWDEDCEPERGVACVYACEHGYCRCSMCGHDCGMCE